MSDEQGIKLWGAKRPTVLCQLQAIHHWVVVYPDQVSYEMDSACQLHT